jgi:uncharacterized protein (TIGR03437 family)
MQKAALLFCAATVALSAQTVTTLYNFSGINSAGSQMGPIIQGADGNLYGTTQGAGANNHGSVFKITPAGTVTFLYNFAFTDGGEPAGLVQAADGNFYGTTATGGSNGVGAGTVFKITPTGSLATLYNFCAQPNCDDGAAPMSGLVLATDGNLYGTTSAGGPNAAGTIFQISPAGVFSVVHSFNGRDGMTPYGGLVQANDGNLYGTTWSGGTTGYGTVFQFTLAGALTTLHSFTVGDGYNSYATLTQANDGNLYGTTERGGDNDLGTIFQITLAGAFTKLHSFAGAEGSHPYCGLIQANDGNFYGTALDGGANGDGTIFEMTFAGAVTTLHSFNSTDGANPSGALMQAHDGNIYGTTSEGGMSGVGTVFKLTPALAVPAITPNGLVNGASFQPGIVANAWFTITGTNLSSVTDTWANAVIDGNLPESLDGVSVSVAGQPAYIYYVSPGQINALAPNLNPGTVSVTVTNSVGPSAPVTAVAQMVQPAFFQWGNYAVATRTDYTLAVKNGTFPGVTTVPAKPGDTIILWGTGFGPTTPPVPQGIAVPSSTVYRTLSPVTVTVGSAAANVIYTVLAPGSAGLYQVAIQMPATMADGDYPVVATISGAQSPSNVLITVEQ